MQKINDDQIAGADTDIFGDWVDDLSLTEKFKNAEPFEHIVIDNFLKPEIAEQIHACFPEDFEKWWKYWNPLEVKYANDRISEMPGVIRNVFYAYSSKKMIDVIQRLSGIPDLEYDPYLHGAGLHAHPRNGRLNMHLDYEKHPHMAKERRLNIILYLNKEWKDEWNGETQLWNSDMTECVTKSHIRFNRAVIFRTNEISWHGLPEKVACPEGHYRKSLAYYYVSPLVTGSQKDKYGGNAEGYRTKAAYKKRPQDPEDSRMERLYQIRPYRRIEPQDLLDIWPEWNPEEH